MRLFKLLLVLVAAALLLLSCTQRDTSVIIKQGNPQQFVISGHGTLDVFTITGPDYERIPYHDGVPYSKDYWVIAPLNDFDVSQLSGPIIYGHVPPGFRQVTPANGQPPEISEGYPYGLQLAIRNGGGVNMLFVVHDGKIVTEADAD